MAERSQDRVEHHVQFLADVFSKEPQHQITVLLKQLILAPVAAVRDRVREMLRAVQFDRHARVGAEQVDFQAPRTVEWDRQRHVDVEPTPGFG